jgi:hypothetical protein
MLILSGNVLLPIFLYWAIALLTIRMSESSSQIIPARYLLLNGRQLYPNLFSMQETFVLLLLQWSLILLQTALTILFASRDHTRASLGFASAFFQSINTRHAGMASFSMANVDAATLLLYLLMMFLAPSPFVAVLQRSDQIQLATRKLRNMLANSVTQAQLWADMAVPIGDITSFEAAGQRKAVSICVLLTCSLLAPPCR